MSRQFIRIAALATIVVSSALGGERSVVSLKNFSDVELKMAGIEVPQSTTFHIKALGAGGDYGWTYKSDELFAYGWIINADTRKLVWKMDTDNTSRSRDDREFDEKVTLERGSYEVYFTVPTFSYHTTFTHFSVNVDHRQHPLFGNHEEKGKDFFGFFKNWWSDDVEKNWERRCRNWGLEMLVDDARSGSIKTFTPPREISHTILKTVKLGEGELVRRGFTITEPTALRIYALGEGTGNYDLFDYGWIVNAVTRAPVWEMQWRNISWAGGAKKNIAFDGTVTLDKGEYVLYFVTDDSHSSLDWNDAPPYDPLHWGVTIAATNEEERKNVKPFTYKEDQNVIVSITRATDDEDRSEGFALKEETRVRVYAFGERSNSRRLMADYGMILDAQTRNKIWTMDVDRSLYAGGASKNRYVDEIITLPKGSYIVSYKTDDSHAYNEWNAKPPFDPEHYGITLMGAGERFNSGVVTKYVEQRDRNMIAQIIRVGDDADEDKRFKIEKTSRVRVYAIGEGQNRQMYDYGWIENAKTGEVVWEMTYSMTFHAGGHRKNRMVNTTILLDKGEYVLHYQSDDSHSYGNWNVDPPEDSQYWGITIYKDESPEVSAPTATPSTPVPPRYVQ